MSRWLLATLVWFAGPCACFRDSCFPAGTLISTPCGNIPIEGLQLGQLVCVLPTTGIMMVNNNERIIRFSDECSEFMSVSGQRCAQDDCIINFMLKLSMPVQWKSCYRPKQGGLDMLWRRMYRGRAPR